MLVFFTSSEGVTLTSCCLGFLSTSSTMVSVGGRLRKSAEELCAELQARARQTITRAGRKEVEDMVQNFVDGR